MIRKRSELVKVIQDTFEFEGLGTQMRDKDALAIADALIEKGIRPSRSENPMLYGDDEWEDYANS